MNASEIRVRRGVVGPHVEHPPIDRFRLIQAPASAQHDAEVIVCFDEIRLDLDRAPAIRFGVRHTPERETARRREIEHRRMRPDEERMFEKRKRIGESAAAI